MVVSCDDVHYGYVDLQRLDGIPQINAHLREEKKRLMSSVSTLHLSSIHGSIQYLNYKHVFLCVASNMLAQEPHQVVSNRCE